MSMKNIDVSVLREQAGVISDDVRSRARELASELEALAAESENLDIAYRTARQTVGAEVEIIEKEASEIASALGRPTPTPAVEEPDGELELSPDPEPSLVEEPSPDDEPEPTPVVPPTENPGTVITTNLEPTPAPAGPLEEPRRQSTHAADWPTIVPPSPGPEPSPVEEPSPDESATFNSNPRDWQSRQWLFAALGLLLGLLIASLTHGLFSIEGPIHSVFDTAWIIALGALGFFAGGYLYTQRSTST